MITINLPDLPPSTNNLFSTVGRKRVKSEKYRAWIEAAGWALKLQRPGSMKGPVEIAIEMHRPNAISDISNRLKSLEDLLVSHGVIDDDRFVQAISARWRTEPGLTIVVKEAK